MFGDNAGDFSNEVLVRSVAVVEMWFKVVIGFCTQNRVMGIEKDTLLEDQLRVKSHGLQILPYLIGTSFMARFTRQKQVMQFIPIDEGTGGVDVLKQELLPDAHAAMQSSQKIKLVVARHMVQHVDQQQIVILVDAYREIDSVVDG